MTKVIDQVITNTYAMYHGDSCDVMAGLPDDCMHYGLHSPPFEGLYKFTNSLRDVSNNEAGDFWEHYRFIIRELLRVTMPGRLHSVHCMQLPATKGREGFIGFRDFKGEIIRAYEAEGWHPHSEVCIWKDPVIAQQRTKSIRLLHKQLVKDSNYSGQGLADYVVTFRKPGDNPEPIAGGLTRFVGDNSTDVSREAYDAHCATLKGDGREPWPFKTWVSIMTWQRYASPVWNDIRQTRVLQYRNGRDEKDEKHISPLQLDVIDRCVELWSNPGERVFSPFAGIGSEVYGAVEMGRFGIGIELKDSYFRQAVLNLESEQ